MAITNLTISRRSLTARLFSTVTTIITVAVAVGLMLVLLSMRESSERAFSRGPGSMHMLLSAESNRLVSVLNAIFYAQPPQSPLSWEQYRALETMGRGFGPPPLSYALPIQQGDSYRGYPVTATAPEFFTRFSVDPGFHPDTPAEEQEGPAWELQEGRFLEGRFEAVLGADVAAKTNLQIGDEIHMTHGAPGNAPGSSPGSGPGSSRGSSRGHLHDEFGWGGVGILEPTGSAHDRAVFIDLTSSWIVHAHDRRKRDASGPIETAVEDITDEDRQITGILVRVATRPGRQTSAATGEMFYKFDREMDFTVAVPSDEVKKLFGIVSNVDDILLGMALVVMFSSGIAIMLALYNSMEQRRRQIAVLRVLGCSRRRVFGLVMAESALLGLGGAVVGAILAFVGARLVAAGMAERLGLVVEPAVAPLTLGVIVLGTVLLACAAGVVPSVLAYRTSVARNLRPIG